MAKEKVQQVHVEKSHSDVQLSESEKIWSEIKDLKLDLFALNGQFVNMHCSPTVIEPTKLYLTLSAPAVLVALDNALSDRFDIESMSLTGKNYAVLSRKVR